MTLSSALLTLKVSVTSLVFLCDVTVLVKCCVERPMGPMAAVAGGEKTQDGQAIEMFSQSQSRSCKKRKEKKSLPLWQV